MSSFNKFMRASAASYRRLERDQQRKSREAARLYRQQQKQEEISNAEQAVEEYNNYIDVLKSIHKETADVADWQSVLQSTPPATPARKDHHEQHAQLKLQRFKPSVLDKLFGSGPRKKKRLELEVGAARLKDDKAHSQAMQQFEHATNEHAFLQETASGVLENDIEAYKAAFEYYDPFSDIAELGANVEIEFREKNATINLQVNSTEVIPDYILSQTSTGKLSRKKMPVSRFQELYQDYVCSAVLRLGREMLQLLPVSYVVVNANGALFDSVTGHTTDSTLVSAIITPEKLELLNFETIDPSDSMRNFHHNMKFSKTNGFSPVEKIDATTLIL